MRHFRVRRQFRITLVLLLAFCMVLFVESRIEAFAPRVKDFVELHAEDALGGEVRLSIGALEGGILRPISFNEIELKDGKDAAIFTSVVIDSIKTNYRLWDLFLRGGEAPAALSRMLSRDAYVYVTFETKDRENSGFVRVDGDLSDARVKGFVKLFTEEKVEFDGRITQGYFTFEVRPAIGSMHVFGRVTRSGEVVMKLRSRRLTLGGVTIAVDAILRNKITVADNGPRTQTLHGSFETRRLVVNGKPFPVVKCRYRVADDRLEIKHFEFDTDITAKGSAGLKAPHAVDLTVLVDNVRLSRLLRLCGAEEATQNFSGVINAKVSVTGPIAKPRSATQFTVRKGAIMELPFDRLTAALKGDGPVLHIEEARITRASGALVLAGELDVSKFAKGTAFDRIELVSDDLAINWDGMRIADLQDTRQVRMDKDISQELRVNFTKYINDDRIDESCRYRDDVKLEYKLNEGDSIALSMQDGAGFMGLQHRDTF